jgi:hypothetical protein
VIEVATGLKAGDAVILNPPASLETGVSVRVQTEDKASGVANSRQAKASIAPTGSRP